MFGVLLQAEEYSKEDALFGGLKQSPHYSAKLVLPQGKENARYIQLQKSCTTLSPATKAASKGEVYF